MLFTVFTPFYDRPDLVRQTYQSLCAQTLRDFEWLVVDDGSAEESAACFRQWEHHAPFPIHYVRQSNRGKPQAYNRALLEARGEFLAVLDDDDALVPNALERLRFHWNSIPEMARSRYSGVSGLCVDNRGRMVGRPFPSDVMDCRNFELEARFGSVGERWGCHRLEILREFPFPEIIGERYCPEGLVWNRMGRCYLVRHVNEVLRVYRRHKNNQSNSMRRLLMCNPRFARMYYQECLALDGPLRWKCKRAVNYLRYSAHAGVPLRQAIACSASPRLCAVAALAASSFYWWDRLRQTSAAHRGGQTAGRQPA